MEPNAIHSSPGIPQNLTASTADLETPSAPAVASSLPTASRSTLLQSTPMTGTLSITTPVSRNYRIMSAGQCTHPLCKRLKGVSMKNAVPGLCSKCNHEISYNKDFDDRTPPISTPITATALMRKLYLNTDTITPRQEMLDEIIERVKDYKLVSVRGTPACGKTTLMRLLANRLHTRYGASIPIYTLTGWERQGVEAAGGWSGYLERITGVRGTRWLGYDAFLLFDEAQQSYWDFNGIWDFFKSITPDHPVKVVLFASYGSPGGGYAGLFEDYTPTPVVHFAKHQLISMKHDSETDNDIPYLFPGREIRRVGLLLDEQETFDVLRRYARSKAHPGLNEEVVRSIHEISNGHIGVVMGIAYALWTSPGLSKPLKLNHTLDIDLLRTNLWDKPKSLYNLVQNCQFIRGLPNAQHLQDPDTAKILKWIIADGGLAKSKVPTERREALDQIVKNGWLHIEQSPQGDMCVFASRFHRWYCGYMLEPRATTGAINFETPWSWSSTPSSASGPPNCPM